MYDDLTQRLHRYTENCVAYKLDADFASAVQETADAIEDLSKENESLGKDLTSAVEMLKKRKKPKWIPVTERLPGLHEEVLVCNEEYGLSELGFAMVAVWDGADWIETWEKREAIHCVTHWMPLPDPLEEEEV